VAEIDVDLISRWIDDTDLASARTRAADAVAAHRGEATSPAGVVGAKHAVRCLHEAGHIVSAFASGLQVGAARVTADGGSAEYAPTCESPDAMMQLAMISTDLAGIVAEYIAGPLSTARAFALANSCDILHATVRLAALRARGFELPTCVPVQAAVIYVLSSWDTIVRVARVLQVLGSLSSEEAVALCAPRQH
jgi:hypothetical protein